MDVTSRFDTQVPAITRRRFGQWGLAATASGVAGCGGGGGGEPAVEPPVKAGTLEMVAGALGGGGFALQQGAMARLPADLTGPAFNAQGDLQFVGLYGWDCRVGCRNRQGVSSFARTYPWSFRGYLFDALGRYLVETGAGSVHFLQGETPVLLAGGGSNTALVDGVGARASVFRFDSPLLAQDGLVYFIDTDHRYQPVLRTLGTDGAVKTLLPLPRGSQLLESATGGVRRYTKFATEPSEWADLVLEGGAYQWRVLPTQWPFDLWTPLRKVHGAQDAYWALAGEQGAREFRIAQLDLSGRTLAVGWKVRGGQATVVQGPSNMTPTSLFVACSDGTAEGGTEIVECRLEFPSTAVYRWLGVQSNPGEVDGQNQARFSFLRGVEALPDGAGGLILLENQRGNSSDAAPVPALRSVSAAGQVSTWSLEPRGNRIAIAYGHLIAYDAQDRALVRTSTNGQSAWQTWVSSSHFASGGRHDPGVQVLRTDTTGLLWFATRYSPQAGDGDVYFGRANGNALVGTIDANGQVKIVAGDTQALYTPQSYPPLAQRPWYMDIADMAFEGGTAQVSWVLCNRVELDGSTTLVRFHPELVRIDTQGIQRFPLSLEIDRNLPEFFREPFKQICVIPGRPGEVFLSSACGVHRWTQAKGLELLAGQAAPTPGGVLLGPLPAGLNLVKFLAPGVDRRSLYVGSENSVLKLVLPD
ncbi:hypothetical protein IB236_07665 [Acidovorax sp. ACV02]|uniref:hypothetical protein n=1 Tax=Acidovorax sp. ACV02 TaxID=2769310 RepID=UPI00177DCD7F|nr:hypothetical protein [Acidovorax sp. ACV02]MBD9405208.1 hypothetical protein [Acidovorax sp. ACV02]